MASYSETGDVEDAHVETKEEKWQRKYGKYLVVKPRENQRSSAIPTSDIPKCDARASSDQCVRNTNLAAQSKEGSLWSMEDLESYMTGGGGGGKVPVVSSGRLSDHHAIDSSPASQMSGDVTSTSQGDDSQGAPMILPGQGTAQEHIAMKTPAPGPSSTVVVQPLPDAITSVNQPNQPSTSADLQPSTSSEFQPAFMFMPMGTTEGVNMGSVPIVTKIAPIHDGSVSYSNSLKEIISNRLGRKYTNFNRLLGKGRRKTCPKLDSEVKIRRPPCDHADCQAFDKCVEDQLQHFVEQTALKGKIDPETLRDSALFQEVLNAVKKGEWKSDDTTEGSGSPEEADVVLLGSESVLNKEASWKGKGLSRKRKKLKNKFPGSIHPSCLPKCEHGIFHGYQPGLKSLTNLWSNTALEKYVHEWPIPYIDMSASDEEEEPVLAYKPKLRRKKLLPEPPMQKFILPDVLPSDLHEGKSDYKSLRYGVRIAKQKRKLGQVVHSKLRSRSKSLGEKNRNFWERDLDKIVQILDSEDREKEMRVKEEDSLMSYLMLQEEESTSAAASPAKVTDKKNQLKKVTIEYDCPPEEMAAKKFVKVNGVEFPKWVIDQMKTYNEKLDESSQLDIVEKIGASLKKKEAEEQEKKRDMKLKVFDIGNMLQGELIKKIGYRDPKCKESISGIPGLKYVYYGVGNKAMWVKDMKDIIEESDSSDEEKSEDSSDEDRKALRPIVSDDTEASLFSSMSEDDDVRAVNRIKAYYKGKVPPGPYQGYKMKGLQKLKQLTKAPIREVPELGMESKRNERALALLEQIKSFETRIKSSDHAQQYSNSSESLGIKARDAAALGAPTVLKDSQSLSFISNYLKTHGKDPLVVPHDDTLGGLLPMPRKEGGKTSADVPAITGIGSIEELQEMLSMVTKKVIAENSGQNSPQTIEETNASSLQDACVTVNGKNQPSEAVITYLDPEVAMEAEVDTVQDSKPVEQVPEPIAVDAIKLEPESDPEESENPVIITDSELDVGLNTSIESVEEVPCPSGKDPASDLATQSQSDQDESDVEITGVKASKPRAKKRKDKDSKSDNEADKSVLMSEDDIKTEDGKGSPKKRGRPSKRIKKTPEEGVKKAKLSTGAVFENLTPHMDRATRAKQRAVKKQATIQEIIKKEEQPPPVKKLNLPKLPSSVVNRVLRIQYQLDLTNSISNTGKGASTSEAAATVSRPVIEIKPDPDAVKKEEEEVSCAGHLCYFNKMYLVKTCKMEKGGNYEFQTKDELCTFAVLMLLGYGNSKSKHVQMRSIQDISRIWMKFYSFNRNETRLSLDSGFPFIVTLCERHKAFCQLSKSLPTPLCMVCTARPVTIISQPRVTFRVLLNGLKNLPPNQSNFNKIAESYCSVKDTGIEKLKTTTRKFICPSCCFVVVNCHTCSNKVKPVVLFLDHLKKLVDDHAWEDDDFTIVKLQEMKKCLGFKGKISTHCVMCLDCFRQVEPIVEQYLEESKNVLKMMKALA